MKTPIHPSIPAGIGVAVIALISLAITSTGPLHSAVQIGGDEHYEVIKALLWAKGVPLYDPVWNDQPPLYTVLLGTLFRMQPTIDTARALAVSFGLLLLTGCFVLVRERSGALAASLAAIALLTAPSVLELGVSVMLEVPAIATALWALWPIRRWAATRNLLWLGISGALVAIALQTKLTAAVISPALLVEIVMASQRAAERSVSDTFRSLAIWAGCAAALFVGLGLLFGGGYYQAWVSHFSTEAFYKSEASKLAFGPTLLTRHTATIWAAITAFVLMLVRRDWRRLVFPCVLLWTVSVIHTWHRPWWDYYYLHFALPLAWLTGHSISALVTEALRLWRRADALSRLLSGAAALWAITLTGFLAIDGGERFMSEANRIRSLRRVENDPIVAKMREFADRTEWVYTQSTDNGIYGVAFISYFFFTRDHHIRSR